MKANETRPYAIQSHDGYWLLGYRPGGEEFLNDGRYNTFYTCIWGEHLRDACRFKTRGDALNVAAAVRHCYIIYVGGDYHKHKT